MVEGLQGIGRAERDIEGELRLGNGPVVGGSAGQRQERRC